MTAGAEPLRLAALFPVNMGNRGQNVFPLAEVFEKLRAASAGVTYIGHHGRISGNFVFRYSQDSDPASAARIAEGILRLRRIARPLRDLAGAEAAIPPNATVVRRSVVVPKGSSNWRVVLVMLSEDVSSSRRMTGSISPRVDAMTWTSVRDVLCLYDRPGESGDVGQVTRTVLAALSDSAASIVGTGRAMSVICDLLAGRYVHYSIGQ